MGPYNPRTRNHASYRGGMNISAGSFVLDGPNDPSVFGGAVKAVTRELEGPNVFFRVTLDDTIDVTDPLFSITGSGINVGAPNQDVVVTFGSFTATDPPAALNPSNQIDVAVMTALVPTETAGIKVMFQYSKSGV